MLRLFLLSLALLSALGAGGCTLAAVAVIDQLDVAVSKIAQSDCELVRLAHGVPICSEEETQEAPRVFCYRRLGAVDCYRSRNPEDEPIVSPSPDVQSAGLKS